LPGAHVDFDETPGGSPRRHVLRASRLVRGAMVGFIAVAVVSVFQCVAARAGQFHACVAAFTCLAALCLFARAWERRQPVAIRHGPDGLTTWDRAGVAQYRRITGCAQWSDRLLALTLLSSGARSVSFLVAADAVGRDTFRELAVRARRGARAYL
jgi:hypothetical protein